jgi:hypothetical protein
MATCNPPRRRRARHLQLRAGLFQVQLAAHVCGQRDRATALNGEVAVWQITAYDVWAWAACVMRSAIETADLIRGGATAPA